MLRDSGGSVHIFPFLWQWISVAAFCLSAMIPSASAQQKPKVRSITAFIRVDAEHYGQEISDTAAMLRNAKARYGLAGYEVQTIRITTQPFPEYTKGKSKEDALAFLRELDAVGKKEGVMIGIGPAMSSDSDDPAQAELLAEALAPAASLKGNLVVAGSDGVHWKAVHAAAGVMKYLEDHTPGGVGNFNFTAAANVPAYTPFYPASFHEGLGHQFAVALESANVVEAVMAVQRDPEGTRQALVAELGLHARAIADIADKIDQDTGWSYMGIDLSPAPHKEVSIGSALAGFTGSHFGAGGTLTGVATITAALRDINIKKVGFNGVMMPVLEDTRLAQLWSQGGLSIDQILGYSSVCGTGLDTIPLPGDVTTQQLERIIGDMATLSVRYTKPLTARLMPVPGAKPGDQTAFDDPNLVNTVIQALP
jgi:uncharacterized protein (UPF0210 family)